MMINDQNFVKGFTLIELMIVVAIVGILAAFSIPSYQRYVTESRRADAQSYMMELSMRAERLRGNNATYLDHTAGAMNVVNTQFYTFTITDNTATAYNINAVAQNVQASRDVAACTTLVLNQNGTRTPAQCWRN